MAITANEVVNLNVGSVVLWHGAIDGDVTFLKATGFDETLTDDGLEKTEVFFWVSPNLMQFAEIAFTDDEDFLSQAEVLYAAAAPLDVESVA